MTALPTGTVTFLFTDIAGSTRMLQRLGDDYRRVLEDHYSLLRAAFVAAEGHEISTEGDAFFVVFESAPAAVAAAVAAQRALDRHEWPAGEIVRVRIGLHTGEGVLAGDDYWGIDVHRAARIMAAGHGGQVLLSGTTEALVRDALPPGVSLRDLGEHRLKDLARPERIAQLSIEGLPDEFPALKSLDARPTNLQEQLTTFVGRAKEIADVRQLMKDVRLITLTGPGGTGKTRLSLETARASLNDFSDGVFFVPLAPVLDPDIVPSTIAHEVGIQETTGRPVLETIKEELAGKEMLLVLDNFEHLTEAAEIVQEILRAAPGLRVLVTSRGALHLSGEHEYMVQPLEMPEPDRLPSISELAEFEAVALFVQRAAAVRPGFAVTDENAEPIARICAALDGLPLAIELAAARIRVLSPHQIADRLQSRLALLTSGARDLPARQRTLRGAIDWSHDLLEPEDARLFARLSVFVGGCTLDGADAVCNPGGELGIETLDGLDSLLDKSLIRHHVTDEGGTRFRMLQVIREYALERFEAGPEQDMIRRRHAEFFLALAEDAEGELTGPKQAEVLISLGPEHDNFRAALRFAIDSGATSTGLRMAGALWRFWYLRTHLAEGRQWLTDLLALPPPEDDVAARAKALGALGSLVYWENDFVWARRCYEESLELYARAGDTPGEAEQHYNLGYIATIEGDYRGARAHYQEAKELYDRAGDRKGAAYATMGVGIAASFAGDSAEATAAGTESLLLFRELGEWYGENMSSWVLFRVARREGDWDRARQLLIESIPSSVEAGDVLGTASWLLVLSEVLLKTGDPARAVRLEAAADAVRTATGGGAPLPLMDLPESSRDAAVELLGNDRVEALWAEGSAMSLEEAVAEALTGVGESGAAH